jgi:hypothetical protein
MSLQIHTRACHSTSFQIYAWTICHSVTPDTRPDHLSLVIPDSRPDHLSFNVTPDTCPYHLSLLIIFRKKYRLWLCVSTTAFKSMEIGYFSLSLVLSFFFIPSFSLSFSLRLSFFIPLLLQFILLLLVHDVFIFFHFSFILVSFCPSLTTLPLPFPSNAPLVSAFNFRCVNFQASQTICHVVWKNELRYNEWG